MIKMYGNMSKKILFGALVALLLATSRMMPYGLMPATIPTAIR